MNKLYRRTTISIILLALLTLIPTAHAEKFLDSSFLIIPPNVDGCPEDESWKEAKPVSVKDGASDIMITIRSVHTQGSIYFLVTFPDSDESRRHRPWVWNNTASIYEVGPDREDCFVFKWFMGKPPQNYHIDSDEPHTADTWFWKANRTDPIGYADDKIQRLTHLKIDKAKKLKSMTGRTLYLQRKGDWGQAAYFDNIVVDYKGQIIPRFNSQPPSGSRADIKAVGGWRDGYWTIEFSRRLETGNADDIQLETTGTYVFGVSRYEIAGRKPDYNTTQPIYGAGRLSERLVLRFSTQK